MGASANFLVLGVFISKYIGSRGVARVWMKKPWLQPLVCMTVTALKAVSAMYVVGKGKIQSRIAMVLARPD